MTDEDIKSKAKLNYEMSVSVSGGLTEEQIYTEGYKEGYSEGYTLGESIADKAIESLQKATSNLNDEHTRQIEKLKALVEKQSNIIQGLFATNKKANQKIKKLESKIKNKCKDCIACFVKENKQLKAQIEKMKRPQNCKHSGSDYCMTNGYCVCDKWELGD